MANEHGHYWSYCGHCSTEMVICGRCGNNCCNAGYGEEIGPEPGTTIECRACPSAYEMQAARWGRDQASSMKDSPAPTESEVK